MSGATIADFRATGAEFGANIARCALQSMAEGMRDPALHRDYVYGVLFPAKRDELLKLGATDREVAVFMKAASKAAIRVVGEVAKTMEAA